MADDVVKTITIRGKGDGVDQLTESLKKLADAQGAVAVVSDQASKSSLSIEAAYQRQGLRLDETARNQAKMSNETRIANTALAQGVITAEQHAARIALINEKYGQASPLAQAFGKALSGVQGQLVALSAGAGPVGVFLAGLGPWGIAAAAAIGAVTAAFSYLSEEAHALAQRAIELEHFAETTGLATSQLQALSQAAAEHGVQAQETASAIEKFTAAWEQLRQGSGSMLDEIRKVDAGLADQMQRTKDSASALDLLAQAIHRADEAGNVAQRNALARAAGGRGGIAALVGVSNAISEAGGISQLTQNANASGSIVDPQYLQRLKDLQVAIDETRKRAEQFEASIASEQILEAQLRAAEYHERLARAAKDFADAHPDWSGWAQFFTYASAFFGMGPQLGETSPTRITIPVPKSLAVPVPTPQPRPQGNVLGELTPQAQAAQLKDTVAALGSAATAADHYRARVAELKAQLDANKISQETYNKAVAGEGLQLAQTALNARVSLLGPAASMTDLLTQAQYRLVDARKQGASFTPQETAAILANVAAQKLAADTAILTANNVVTAEQLRSAKQAELNVLVAQGKLTQDQMTVSMQAYERVIEQTIQQQEIATAQLPNLMQLQQQAGSLRTQMDTFATDTANNVGTALVNIGTHASSTGDAFRNLGMQVITSLEQMVVKMTIVQPIAAALQATLGGFMGGGGLFSGVAHLFGSANGNVFDGGRVMLHPYALGGVVSDIVVSPTLFPMANGGVGLMGEAGPEAVMPLRRGADGRLGVTAAGGSGSPGGTIRIEISASVDKDGNILPLVKRVSGQVAGQAVSMATPGIVRQAGSAVAAQNKNAPGYIRKAV